LGAAGVGVATILTSPSEIKLCDAARLQFNNKADKYANNNAEYEAILLGLRKFRAIDVQSCILHTDSKVVVGQIEKECITREPTLEKYLALVRRMEKKFKGFTVEYIDRNKNAKADELAKEAAHNTPLTTNIFLQIISDASIKTIEPKPKVINIIQGKDWRAPIMAYLHQYYKPDSTVEQTRMQQRAQTYQIVGNDLSHLVFKPKLNAHSMCVQESSLLT
jgi:ribonuclease HI